MNGAANVQHNAFSSIVFHPIMPQTKRFRMRRVFLGL
jgi:hypothetical protein